MSEWLALEVSRYIVVAQVERERGLATVAMVKDMVYSMVKLSKQLKMMM